MNEPVKSHGNEMLKIVGTALHVVGVILVVIGFIFNMTFHGLYYIAIGPLVLSIGFVMLHFGISRDGRSK